MDNIHDEMQQRNKVRVHWGTLGQASKLEMEACSGPNDAIPDGPLQRYF